MEDSRAEPAEASGEGTVIPDVQALSAVPDVLAPGVGVVFCGINPGRVSAAARAHFANPRNDFWRLLHDAGFTDRLLDPQEQFAALDYGIGLTNAAFRTTPGSGDLRAGDFAGADARLEALAREFRPLVLAFVGKEAYRGAFRERPELGLQDRWLARTRLYVLPSTSPANAAVPYPERLRWFRELREYLEPVDRPAVRALVLDDAGRTLLVRFFHPSGSSFWSTPGGAIDPGESDEQALRRELAEETGLRDFALGPLVHERVHVFVWNRVVRQSERIYLVRTGAYEPLPEVDLVAEGVHDVRWWTLEELERTEDEVAPWVLDVIRASGS